MDTLKKDLQNLMLLSGSKDFEDRLLQLKNTYTTEKEQSFIYEFFLNDMKETQRLSAGSSYYYVFNTKVKNK